MTDKPTLAVFSEVFGDSLRPAPQPTPPPAPTLATEGDAHNKLQRNVDLALDVHHKFMTTEPETAGDKRLALEAANMSVKAALATDPHGAQSPPGKHYGAVHAPRPVLEEEGRLRLRHPD